MQEERLVAFPAWSRSLEALSRLTRAYQRLSLDQDVKLDAIV